MAGPMRRLGADTLGSAAWKEIRLAVLERDGWCCKICRAALRDGDGSAHVDHIVPRDQDGVTTMENLQALCRRCNLIKSRSEASQAALRRRAAGASVAVVAKAPVYPPCRFHADCGAMHSRDW